jgi:hypothetical protein
MDIQAGTSKRVHSRQETIVSNVKLSIVAVASDSKPGANILRCDKPGHWDLARRASPSRRCHYNESKTRRRRSATSNHSSGRGCSSPIDFAACSISLTIWFMSLLWVASTRPIVRSMSTVDRAVLKQSSSAYPPFKTQGTNFRETACQQTIERHLSPEAIEVYLIRLRCLLQPLFERPSESSGCRVCLLCCHFITQPVGALLQLSSVQVRLVPYCESADE